MKRLVCILLLLGLLCGCGRGNDLYDRVISLRTDILRAKSCRFLTQVTADFTDKTYTFTMECFADADGNVQFTVLEPAYIAGISGTITDDGGKLTFDDTALAFELQSDQLFSPVSAPWVLIRSLREGYINDYGMEGEKLRLTVDDSYDEDALTLHIWLGEGDRPIHADIYENNRRILTIEIEAFEIL